MVTCLSVFTIVHVYVCALYNGHRSIKGSLLRTITIGKRSCRQLRLHVAISQMKSADSCSVLINSCECVEEDPEVLGCP